MIERVLENWLDNASERTFQVPFCFMLQAQGYKIIHMTRHCAMELGKDIIAIDDKGRPCAFQLKGSSGKKISISQWRDGINAQIIDLLNCKIIHPSLSSSIPHRSFLVTNGEFEEEVIRAIDDINRQNIDRGQPEKKIETIVRGEMLDYAKRIGSDLWPSELTDINLYLEIYLCDGRGRLPKDKLATMFAQILIDDKGEKKPTMTQCIRNVASCALLCASVISSFSNCSNYFAEIEAWTLYLAYTFACAEKWGIPECNIEDSVNIALDSLRNSLELMCDELINRKHYVEGNAMADIPVFKARMTLIMALMSVYGLWIKNNEELIEHSKFINEFIIKNINNIDFWGEAVCPQFVSLFWYWKTIDATHKPIAFSLNVLSALINRHHPDEKPALYSPYCDENAIFPYLLGLTLDKPDGLLEHSSYCVEGLMHLLVRRNCKSEMKSLWPNITRISLCSFFPEESWQFYLWRNDRGTNISYYPPFTKHWDELVNESTEHSGDNIPKMVKKYPIFLILFLIVFPHRARPDVYRWLDTRLSEQNPTR